MFVSIGSASAGDGASMRPRLLHLGYDRELDFVGQKVVMLQ